MLGCLEYEAWDPDPLDGIELSMAPLAVVPALTPARVRDSDALRRLSGWLVVMRTVVIHADFEHAALTGLFGLLGDARVQVIDMSEEATIDEYFVLAEACERAHPVSVHQSFERESVHSMEQELRQSAMEAFRSEEIAGLLRPAIMFRMCTRMCNALL